MKKFSFFFDGSIGAISASGVTVHSATVCCQKAESGESCTRGVKLAGIVCNAGDTGTATGISTTTGVGSGEETGDDDFSDSASGDQYGVGKSNHTHDKFSLLESQD